MNQHEPANQTSCAASFDQAREQKELIRRQMARRREELDADAVAAASTGLHRQLLMLLQHLSGSCLGQHPSPLHISVYSAIRKEADLSPAWADLANWPARLYFPAVSGFGPSSSLVLGLLPKDLTPERFLVRGHFGIAEPPPSAWLGQLPELDIVLVPGLAFDICGGRLGWGRAYYDRLLAALPGKPVRVGVGYAFQVRPDALPLCPDDVKMNWLLTPAGFFPAGAL